MSDYWIILIPEKPGHVPSERARDKLLAKFSEIMKSDEISVELTEQVRFEHCGGNFGKIFCPNCGKEIGIDWWKERMDEDYGVEKNFRLETLKLPCCGAMRTLHELRYEWQQGFAKFSVGALYPDIAEVSADSLATLETAAECKLRPIYRRF